MNSTLSLYFGQSLRMISSSGPQRRLSQKPGTANSTSVGLPAAIAAAIVEVCMSREGFDEESICAMFCTSSAVRFLLLGAGAPIAGVLLLGRTLKRGSSVLLILAGLSPSTLISTPQSPASGKLTMAV